MQYIMSWTRRNGDKIKDQIYTASAVSRKLMELEDEGCYDIEIVSATPSDSPETVKED